MLLVALLGAGGLGAAAAPEPTVEISATVTNLVLTEETTLTVRLWMPPLEGELKETPPFLAQKPPHVEADFLRPEWWVQETLRPVDTRRMPPLAPVEGHTRNAPFFTLNNYVSDDLLGGMRDPFSLFDDDFGRMLGPRPQRFPFAVSRVTRAGVEGWEFAFETLPLRAGQAGRVEVKALAVKAPVITDVKTQRDRFGRARLVPTVREALARTAPLTLTVAEPPREGRPATYCGAIASNLTITAALDTNVCTAGDPLVLTLTVAGANNPGELVLPSFAAALNAAGVFRVDDGSLKTETLAAARVFTWRVRARTAGTVEFPPLEFAYYNLARRAYETVRTETMPVQVKAGAQATLGALDETGEEADVFPMPDGLDLDARGVASEPLLPHGPTALALFVVAPFVFLFARLAPPVRRRMAARRAARRRATAFARCRRALARRRDAAARAAAVRRFFDERYGVNGAAVTAADARRLMAADFPAADVDLVVGALAEQERAAFSAKTATATVVALALACWTAAGAWAASPDFTYRRANARATHAVQEADFREAARAYAACAEAGVANPVLYCNLGACALLAGDARAAQAAYAFAERRTGETPTTRRGLRAARARLLNDARAELPLTRVFFRPHVLFSLDTRLLVFAGAWALAWLVALLPPGGLRRALLTALTLVVLASGLSVATSFVAENTQKEILHAMR